MLHDAGLRPAHVLERKRSHRALGLRTGSLTNTFGCKIEHAGQEGLAPVCFSYGRNRFGLFEADRSTPAFLAALTCLRAFASGGRLNSSRSRLSGSRPLVPAQRAGEHIHAVMKGASPSPAPEETGDVELRATEGEAELDFVTDFGAEPSEKVRLAPKPPQQARHGRARKGNRAFGASSGTAGVTR